jgi:hypothetical protein
MPDRRSYEMNRSGKSGQMRHANPLDVGCRERRRDLRRLICPNFRPAAAHLFHISALPMHCLAASTFLMTHDYVGQASHDGCCCGEQQEDCNDAGETTH